MDLVRHTTALGNEVESSVEEALIKNPLYISATKYDQLLFYGSLNSRT